MQATAINSRHGQWGQVGVGTPHICMCPPTWAKDARHVQKSCGIKERGDAMIVTRDVLGASNDKQGTRSCHRFKHSAPTQCGGCYSTPYCSNKYGLLVVSVSTGKSIQVSRRLPRCRKRAFPKARVGSSSGWMDPKRRIVG